MSWQPYEVEWKAAARRDLRRLEAALVYRVARAVEHYAATGDGDVKKLQGTEREYRLRVGEWRVISPWISACA